MTGKESEVRLTRITLTRAEKCPTCGRLPEFFDGVFERRVERLYLNPRKSEWYYLDVDGQPYRVQHHPDQSKPGMYAAIVVPMALLGKIVSIRPKPDSEAIVPRIER